MGSNTWGRSRLLRWLAWTGGLAVLAALGVGLGFYLAFVRDLPDIRSVEDYRPPLASVVYDRMSTWGHRPLAPPAAGAGK